MAWITVAVRVPGTARQLGRTVCPPIVARLPGYTALRSGRAGATTTLTWSRLNMTSSSSSAQPGVEKIDPGQMAEYKRKGFNVLDVRTREEFEQGRVPGAVLVPLLNGAEDGKMVPNPSFEEQVQESVDRDAKYMLICGSGMRSAKAGLILTQKLGFDLDALRDVEGGMQNYLKSGLPVEK